MSSNELVATLDRRRVNWSRIMEPKHIGSRLFVDGVTRDVFVGDDGPSTFSITTAIRFMACGFTFRSLIRIR